MPWQLFSALLAEIPRVETRRTYDAMIAHMLSRPGENFEARVAREALQREAFPNASPILTKVNE